MNQDHDSAAGKPAASSTDAPASIRYGEVELCANDNYQPRCPVAFVLDTSGSMTGAPIEELKAALPGLFQDLLKNDLTAARVEPCLITCGGEAKLILPFGPLQDLAGYQPGFRAEGETPLGGALLLAMSEVKKRCAQLSSQGIATYVPAIVVLTDGHPTDFEWKQAAAELGALANQSHKGWTVIAIGIGKNADFEALKLITSPILPPLQLQGLAFADLFRWLSQSLQAGTKQAPGATTTGMANAPLPGALSTGP